MDRTTWILLISVVLLLGGMYWVRRNTERRGTGLFGAVCPRCAEPLPTIRKASSFREILWGGWTCPSCGCKVDKYGKKRNWY
jgi:hypothetical protein